MGLDISDDVALVALFVSLVALLVSTLQLSSQLLSTAEGYRRCKKTFIGPWAGQTRRKFLPSEFRFETSYVTPNLSLFDPRQRNSQPLVYLETRFHHPSKDPLYFTVHPHAEPDPTWLTSIARRLRLSTRLLLRNLKVHKQPSNILPEKADTGQSDLVQGPGIASVKYQVSWLSLLTTLHEMASCCSLKRCTCSNERVLEPSFAKLLASSTIRDRDSFSDGKRRSLEDNASEYDTHPVVMYNRHSWDLVPPDISRPLATSSVGEIVVLALRLGMQWRNIQPATRQMSADGNGMSITALGSIAGAGCVLSFERSDNRDFEMNPEEMIIQSACADAMMCGVLPVDRLLHPTQQIEGRAFPHTLNIIQGDLKIGIAVLLDFLQVGFPDELRENNPDVNNIRNGAVMGPGSGVYRRPPFNDLIFLVAPFIPIPGTTARNVLFNGWAGRGPCSIFNYFECRIALWRRLQKRMGTTFGSRETMKRIYALFSFLRLEFSGDFNLDGRSAAINCTDGYPCQPQDRLALVTICRSIHYETGEWFTTKGEKKEKGSDSTPLRYKDLLAGHFVVATKAAKDAQSKFREKDPQEWWEEHNYAEDSGRPGGGGNVRPMYAIALEYVDHVKDGELRDWLHKYRDCKCTAEEVEEAWWMLILRGLSWAMSVHIVCGRDVASSHWRDATPVYFT